MKIHEYQGKEIFRNFSIPTPQGYLIENIDEAETVVRKAQRDFDTEILVIKAQIHAGGRGKGGGVKVSKNYDAAISNINKIMVAKAEGPAIKGIAIGKTVISS